MRLRSLVSSHSVPGPKLGNAWPPRNHLPGSRRPIFPQTSGEDQKKKNLYAFRRQIFQKKKTKGLHAFRRPMFPPKSALRHGMMAPIARWSPPLRAPYPFGGAGGASFGTAPYIRQMLSATAANRTYR